MKTVQGMEFTVEEGLCDQRFIDALDITILTVLGSAEAVKEEEVAPGDEIPSGNQLSLSMSPSGKVKASSPIFRTGPPT